MPLRLVTCCAIAIGLAGVASPSPTSAQWTNRYSKLSDFGHHIYFEQHELPILAHGPTDPAAAPTVASITLTTCHPLFSTRERYVVHGTLDSWVPRDAGRPAELGGEA